MRHLLKACLFLVLLAGLFSCDKRIPTQAQLEPGILSFSEDILPLENGEYLYRQSMEVEQDFGTDSVFSWKVETISGETPSGWFADADGWLWFRVPDTDQSLPLSQPGSHRTLWTSNSKLDFDFHSHEEKLADVVAKVELRVKKADGKISHYSSGFKSERLISSHIGTDFENGDQTGAGLEFRLNEIPHDIYVEGLYADHFMFRLNILDQNLDRISEGEWYSSLEMQNMRRVKLGMNTTPALIPNNEHEFTEFECYVVSRQGLEEANPKSVYFQVQGGFRPQALIYSQTLVALGQHHYTLDNTDYPYTLIPPNRNHFNRQPWQNDNGWELIHSSDLKLHLQWGYHGQFGKYTSSGVELVTDNPFDEEINLCLDATNDNSYYSKIEYFYLRFNGAPFPVQPHFVNPSQVTYEGKTWLRVLNRDHDTRSHVIGDLSPGNNKFEVCAVDTQGAISETAETVISLKPVLPFANRNGLLIFDDSPGNPQNSPEDYVNNFYNTILPDQWGPLQRYEILQTDSAREVSPALMQQFKAVVWHSDNPTSTPSLDYTIDALDIFLDLEGALLISSSSQLYSFLELISSHFPAFAANHFGINGHQDFGVLGSFSHRPYFIRSEAQNNQGSMDLMIDNAFHPIVRVRQGLGPVTWFNYKPNWPFHHRFGCKPVDHPVFPPTQEEYDLYSNKYVGYQHGRVFVFGIPLSYMEPADAAPAVNIILNRLLEPSKMSWRKK